MGLVFCTKISCVIFFHIFHYHYSSSSSSSPSSSSSSYSSSPSSPSSSAWSSSLSNSNISSSASTTSSSSGVSGSLPFFPGLSPYHLGSLDFGALFQSPILSFHSFSKYSWAITSQPPEKRPFLSSYVLMSVRRSKFEYILTLGGYFPVSASACNPIRTALRRNRCICRSFNTFRSCPCRLPLSSRSYFSVSNLITVSHNSLAFVLSCSVSRPSRSRGFIRKLRQTFFSSSSWAFVFVTSFCPPVFTGGILCSTTMPLASC